MLRCYHPLLFLRLTFHLPVFWILLVFLVFNLVQVINSTRISASWHPVLSNSLENHTLLNALLEATILTSVALRLCYLTVAIRDARIHTPVLYRAFEETFTSLTGDDTVVQASRPVLTNHADHWLFLLLLFFWSVIYLVVLRPQNSNALRHQLLLTITTISVSPGHRRAP